MTKKTKQQDRGQRSTTNIMLPLGSNRHPHPNAHSNHSSWSLTCELDDSIPHYTEDDSSTAQGQQNTTQQYHGHSGPGANGKGSSSTETDALLFGIGSQLEPKSQA